MQRTRDNGFDANEISGNPWRWPSHQAPGVVLSLRRNLSLVQFPGSISEYFSLHELNLGTNAIGGPIPDTLSHLRHLRQTSSYHQQPH
ncbi:hypothetical protein Leryth_005209 [Lithospermum erythrorhizon]|nr:hypothetical protein Leryth_005209 [Lithospermum erythrorhizon]